MLLTKKVKVGWSGKNRQHFESLGYKWTKRDDKFIVPVNHLQDTSNYRVRVLCDFCGEVFETMYISYVTSAKGEDGYPHYDSCNNNTCTSMKKSAIAGREIMSVRHIPTLLAEWCVENDVRPERVLAGSNKICAWECSACTNIWYSTPYSRLRQGSKCQKCKRDTVAYDRRNLVI